MMCARASITASVGVPVTEKRRSSCRRSRTGVVRVSEWPAPDCSSVGATIQMSSLNLRATDSSSLRPRAFTPSSLVSNIRTRDSLWGSARNDAATAKGAAEKLRHIRNRLAISSRRTRHFLFSVGCTIIGRDWGCRLFPDKSRESQQYLPPAAPVGPAAARRRRLVSRGGSGIRSGGGHMATALVDLYGGDDFEPFDRIILAGGLSPVGRRRVHVRQAPRLFPEKAQGLEGSGDRGIARDHGAAPGRLRCASRTLPTGRRARPTGASSSALATASASSSPRSIARSAVSTKASTAIAK